MKNLSATTQKKSRQTTLNTCRPARTRDLEMNLMNTRHIGIGFLSAGLVAACGGGGGDSGQGPELRLVAIRFQLPKRSISTSSISASSA